MLKKNWEEAGYYVDPQTREAAVSGIQQHLLVYHVYRALMGGGAEHVARASALARRLADAVRPDGYLDEPNGVIGDHPAAACSVADALGTFCYYGTKLGVGAELIAAGAQAIERIVRQHPAVRIPSGISGKTQQLRFELRAWYWAWRVVGGDFYRQAFWRLWENGLSAYRNVIVYSQPSLRPDYTWNYACYTGSTVEYATNTHTPTYYCTEAQGLLFVYLHGLKDGVIQQTPEGDEFCHRYAMGLLRNLSRAGHTASDVDGYGVHRAWFGGCLVETIPVEAAGLAARLGLGNEAAGWFRWYVDRYADFVARAPQFKATGLPEQFPYGHHITVESQFPALLGARFYSFLARGLFEYGLDEMPSVEPPAYCSYAWGHHWLRVSTPRYETSFVGATTLCGVPFDSRNLGCIHGGSPLATLFSESNLLYATSVDPDGLWHVELEGTGGETWRSCSTSFGDEVAMSVKTSDGKLLGTDTFQDYEAPHCSVVDENPTEVLWSKFLRRDGIRFFVNSAYWPDRFSSTWGFKCPRGNAIKRAAFVLAIPSVLSPEICRNGTWRTLLTHEQGEGWPEALRWKNGGACVTVSLRPEAVESPDGFRFLTTEMPQVVPLPPLRTAWKFEVEPISAGERSPGGANSFCPFPVLQLRLEVGVGASMTRAALVSEFSFDPNDVPHP
ncbi:MAG: hypothetical protein ACFUZC_12285 [Chthoniobacteraceae bacterium]